MTHGTRVGIVAAFTLALTVGCAGPQKAMDQHFAKEAVGQKYSDLTSRSGLKVRVDYGKVLATEKLDDASTLYVHAREYESASSSTLGLWGSREYSYSITAFKVKDDVVQDWAYGLFTPQKQASTIFGIEYGYDHDAAMAGIKKDYPGLIKTSSEQTLAAWKK